MEIRHLRYFSAVADHGSVAEASRRLNIAQPALSRQIMDLEEELNASLFVRGARGVTLTAAGQQFRKDAERLLQDLEEAKERVSRITSGQLGSLRIGMTPNYTWHPALLKPLQKFRQSNPSVALLLEPSMSARQLDDIRSGKLEGGFLAWRSEEDTHLQGFTMFRNRLLLAIPASSPMAKRPPARLKDLRDEPCIWFPRTRSPRYYDFLIHQCLKAGFSPKLVQLGSDVSTILGLVAAGMGYSIVSDASRFNCPRDVVLFEHPDLSSSYDVEFVWSDESRSPTLENFIRFLKKYTVE
ncbi:LysR family transcriptional regulator [Herbaspirillum frisingense]|uniref:LysR family transcriptional regulator n=1 Tax=Herbaspirillum frisingense TaxID=92645 RepID=UPI001603C3C3|nr:LysR family transcriptional regulator [Herbaspirillum frisingense]QNB06143.1 LysR family transcriptional regulator [Herbaspirillum frisingense]